MGYVWLCSQTSTVIVVYPESVAYPTSNHSQKKHGAHTHTHTHALKHRNHPEWSQVSERCEVKRSNNSSSVVSSAIAQKGLLPMGNYCSMFNPKLMYHWSYMQREFVFKWFHCCFLDVPYDINFPGQNEFLSSSTWWNWNIPASPRILIYTLRRRKELRLKFARAGDNWTALDPTSLRSQVRAPSPMLAFTPRMKLPGRGPGTQKDWTQGSIGM